MRPEGGGRAGFVRAAPPRVGAGADLVVLTFGLVIAALLWADSPRIGIEQYRLPKELAVLLVTGIAAVVASMRASRWRADPVMLLGAACLAWALLALLLRAHNVWLGWRVISGYWCALLAYAIVRRHVHLASTRALVLACIACAGGVVALTTLLEHYGIVEGYSLVHRAPSGVFGHRNQAAHFITLSLPAALALLWSDRRARALGPARLLRGIGLLCTALGGAAIVATRARASWVALLVGATFVAGTLLLPRARAAERRYGGAAHPDEGAWTHRRAAAAWLAMLILGALLGATLPSAMDWRTPLGDSAARLAEFDQGSGKGRLEQYRTTFSIALANPVLGVGPGNWAVEYPRFARRGDPSILAEALPTSRLPLSDWLGTLAEAGFPMLLAVACMALVVAVPAARGLGRQSRSRPIHTADVALLLLLAEVAILGSLDAVVQNALPAAVVATLVAVLARRGGRARTLFGSARGRLGVLAAVLAASTFLTFLAGRRLAAVTRYGDDPHQATFLAAAQIDPTDFLAQFFLALGHVRAKDCISADPYLDAARALHPHAPSVASLTRACRAALRAPGAGP